MLWDLRRIIDICPTSVYTNQEPLLTPVIAEVTEGNDIMEEQFEIEEDLPARSGDRWMKRWDISYKACIQSMKLKVCRQREAGVGRFLDSVELQG